MHNRPADISQGGIGSPEKWTTVLVETEQRKKIFDAAAKEGYFKRKKLPTEGLEKIKELARLKFHVQSTAAFRLI